MQDIIVGMPISRRMARRFVAGETLPDAIEAIRASNAAGLLATLDYLGEHVHNQAEASANADEYIRALQAIQEAGVDSNISIKLTAMGLAVDDEFCYHNVRRIVEAAAQRATSCASTWRTRPSPTAPWLSTAGCVTSSPTWAW
jgi:proline dehydrogenase